MPILTYYPPWQDQAESGNKCVKTLTDFMDKLKTKMPASTSTAEKQTAGKLGGSDAKDIPSSCINDHQDNTNSLPSFGDFTGGLKTPVPNDHSTDCDDCLLQYHKLMKEEGA